jgi:hypothetical protein
MAREFGGGCPSPHTPSMAGETVQPLFDALSPDLGRFDQEVIELPLLLPRWQALELEAAASRRGMTTGQMIRRVIGEMLASQPSRAAGS